MNNAQCSFMCPVLFQHITILREKLEGDVCRVFFDVGVVVIFAFVTFIFKNIFSLLYFKVFSL